MRHRSPFWDRMKAYSSAIPPLLSNPADPDHELYMAAMNRRAEMDIGVRLKMKELKELVPSFVLTRMLGGSGFPVAQVIRRYFLEYLDRVYQFGPHSLPTSFNVIESFLSFSRRFLAFDIREEREHLLRFHEYIDWYTGGGFPDKPGVLTDILTEGLVYSYHMVSPLEDFTIDTKDSKLRVLGVAMVRHQSELSAMIVAGEYPPYPTDKEIADLSPDGIIPLNHKTYIKPAPSLGIQDRYLPELPGHVSVIMLTRFDLNHSRFDARYVNVDIGSSYFVYTDDIAAFRSKEMMAEFKNWSTDGLERYSAFFSALASMLYLPVFFIEQGSRVVESKFGTELHVDSAKSRVKKAVKAMGSSQAPFFRVIRCMVGSPPHVEESIRILQPPDMAFESSGYWRPIAAGEIGQAKDGTPILGKTWVQRTDSWTAKSLHSFTVSKEHRQVDGKDPGTIYIMRSGSHYADIYKIGLTRLTGEARASELSKATGVPTQFEVLAQWQVGDCSKAEKEIHTRLKALRVNKRREFFRGSLQTIIGVIDTVLREGRAEKD